MISKKAAAVWVSWVLLVGIFIFLSATIGKWWISRSQEMVNAMDEKVNAKECDYVFLRVSQGCQDIDRIKIVLDNPSPKTIDGFKVTLFDIYGEVETKEINRKIYRNSHDITLYVLKDEVVKEVTLVPFFIIPEKPMKIVCENKRIILHDVRFCDEQR